MSHAAHLFSPRPLRRRRNTNARKLLYFALLCITLQIILRNNSLTILELSRHSGFHGLHINLDNMNLVGHF